MLRSARRQPTGMAAFTVLWLGQVLSTVGTRMTNFVLGIWVWQRTGHASDLALLIFSAFGATVLFSPLAGSFVDRWSRRLTIMLSDLGSAATTLVTLVLFLTGTVQLWQLVIVNAVTGAFLAFQAPAYGAAITAMMPKKHYARANGMMSLVRSVPAIFAPALAGSLLAVTSISTVILVDVVSYFAAIGTVFLVTLPPMPRAEERKPVSLWKDSFVGLRYIARHRGLAGMQAMLFVVGLLSAMGYLVLTPLVLSRSPHGHGEAALGLVQSVGAIGGVLGAVVLGALKSPANKMARVLTAILVFSVLGRIVLGVGDSLVAWTAAWFCSWLCVPFIEGYSMAIWQEKVAPAIQGRVFAAQQIVQQLALPLGFAITGPLADRWFEPQMMPGGGLAPVFGHLVGTGPGAGMALVFVVSGVLGILTALAGFAARAVRDLEQLIPDANVA